MSRPFENIDLDAEWQKYQPAKRRDLATLLFVVSADRILLIRKKRGLGAGKINGPGGRREDEEPALSCAVRETQEELGITPLSPVLAGELSFLFTDRYAISVSVFRCDAFEGVPTETEEAAPIWVALDEIPYDEMWPDDRLWLPRLLEGEWFSGRVLFDGERMLGYQL